MIEESAYDAFDIHQVIARDGHGRKMVPPFRSARTGPHYSWCPSWSSATQSSQ